MDSQKDPLENGKWAGKEGSHLSLPLPHFSYIRETLDPILGSSVIILSEF